MADKENNQELQHIIRIANADIKGTKHILYGLTRVKGIGIMYANAACQIAHIDTQKKAGALTEQEVERLNEIVKNPIKSGMPLWLLNRRKDYETGEDMHLLTGDIIFVKDQDIKRMRKTKTYKGMRHGVGLTVRGQKTKSNARRQKGKGLGVKKKKK